MKCLVINRIPLDADDRLLRRKHGEQVDAFVNLGFDTVTVGFQDNKCYVVHGENLAYVCQSSVHGYQSYRAMFKAVYKALREFGGFDIAYMRMIPATPELLLFLQRIKPHCEKLVYEFPTFPYDAEMAGGKGIARRVCYRLDKACRHALRHYVDCVATFSGDASIFGIKAVSIVNGVDVSQYPPHAARHRKDGKVRMLCVAKVSGWHAYDRLIKGLGQYAASGLSKARPVEIDIAGEGEALDGLKLLAEREGVSGMVRFHGTVLSSALSDLFARADLAIESLGLHRIGCAISSTLKSREYMARGIPFIHSAIIPGIQQKPWALKFAADDSPIDIMRVLSWYDGISGFEVGPQMRAYAVEHLRWEAQIEKILRAL